MRFFSRKRLQNDKLTRETTNTVACFASLAMTHPLPPPQGRGRGEPPAMTRNGVVSRNAPRGGAKRCPAQNPCENPARFHAKQSAITPRHVLVSEASNQQCRQSHTVDCRAFLRTLAMTIAPLCYVSTPKS